MLSGEIPSTLSNLTFLSYLELSYNDLTGRIPSGVQLDTRMQSIHLCTLATSVFVDILFKTIARVSVMHQSKVAWEELKKVMGYHSFILDSGAASWLVHGLHLVFCCSRETGELLAFDSRTSCTTKYMSLLLHGQEQDKHKLISKHEAKAMVGASTKISQCMHV